MKSRKEHTAASMVKSFYLQEKPVMGSHEDTYDGHARAFASAKLSAIRVITEWPDTPQEQISTIVYVLNLGREMT